MDECKPLAGGGGGGWYIDLHTGLQVARGTNLLLHRATGVLVSGVVARGVMAPPLPLSPAALLLHAVIRRGGHQGLGFTLNPKPLGGHSPFPLHLNRQPSPRWFCPRTTPAVPNGYLEGAQVKPPRERA